MRTTTSTAAGTPARPGGFDRRQLATLGAAMLGFFVVALDAQIVNVALPDIGADLGGGLSGLQWLVTGYTLTFAALIRHPMVPLTLFRSARMSVALAIAFTSMAAFYGVVFAHQRVA